MPNQRMASGLTPHHNRLDTLEPATATDAPSPARPPMNHEAVPRGAEDHERAQLELAAPASRRPRPGTELDSLENDLPGPFRKSVTRFRLTGATMVVYEFDAVDHGGIAFVRHSAAEDPTKEGTTTLAQFRPIAELCRRKGLPLKTLVVTFANSGDNRWEHRPDLLLLHERLRSIGAPEFVVFNQDDRFTRNLIVAEMMLSLVRLTGLDLWLVDLGRPIDPREDELLVRIKALIGAVGRTVHLDRTQRGILEAWAAGKVTGGLPYAVRRNDEGYPEFVLEEYEVVRRMFTMAADAGPDGSAAAIAKRLTAEGHCMTAAQVRNLLRSDVYVTGAISRTDKATGDVYWLRPMTIDDPISADLRERALLMLDNRDGLAGRGILQSPNSRVTLLHGACAGEYHEDGRPFTLTSRIKGGRNSDGSQVVAHDLTPRSSACSGLSLPDGEVERLICLTLFLAAQCLPHHECQTPDEEIELKAQERRLVAHLDEVVGDSVAQGVPLEELTGSLTRQVSEVRNRLRVLALDPILTASQHHLATRENLIWAARQILLGEGRENALIERRALLFDRGVSKAVIHTDDDQQITVVEIYGYTLNKGDDTVSRRFFLTACSDILLEYLESHFRGCANRAEEGDDFTFRASNSGMASSHARNALRPLSELNADRELETLGADDPAWAVHLDVPANKAYIRIGSDVMTLDQALSWTLSRDRAEEVANDD